MLTGIREAVRALHLLRDDSPEAAGEAADQVASENYRPRKKARPIPCTSKLASCETIALGLQAKPQLQAMQESNS